MGVKSNSKKSLNWILLNVLQIQSILIRYRFAHTTQNGKFYGMSLRKSILARLMNVMQCNSNGQWPLAITCCCVAQLPFNVFVNQSIDSIAICVSFCQPEHTHTHSLTHMHLTPRYQLFSAKRQSCTAKAYRFDMEINQQGEDSATQVDTHAQQQQQQQHWYTNWIRWAVC